MWKLDAGLGVGRLGFLTVVLWPGWEEMGAEASTLYNFVCAVRNIAFPFALNVIISVSVIVKIPLDTQLGSTDQAVPIYLLRSYWILKTCCSAFPRCHAELCVYSLCPFP